MKKRWNNKNVDLDALSKRVEEFYLNQGLQMTVEHAQDIYFMNGIKRVEKKTLVFSVKINGSSNDFSIEFSGSRTGRGIVLFSPLVTMFGGGALILDRLKVEGFYEALERDFWTFVEEAVERSEVS
jgi:hypothetical protein